MKESTIGGIILILIGIIILPPGSAFLDSAFTKNGPRVNTAKTVSPHFGNTFGLLARRTWLLRESSAAFPFAVVYTICLKSN